MAARLGAWAALGVFGVACGARSSLDLPATGGAGSTSVSTTTSSTAKTSTTTGATTSSTSIATTTSVSSTSSGPPCTSDADCDDGVDCTSDACAPTGCVHTPNDAKCDDGLACTTDTGSPSGCVFTPNDALCDDGLFCTVDTCVVGAGCQNVHSDAVCDDGIACTTDTCDIGTDACRHVPCDSMCPQTSFCAGIARCDTALGCTVSQPSCDLGLGCSIDSCDETNDACSHTMPVGCAPDVHLLVDDQGGALYSLQPYTGQKQLIAPANGHFYLDVAILNGRWFAIGGGLFELVPGTNQIKNMLPGPSVNSLGAGPDGFLYGASTQIYRIDPDTGASSVIAGLALGQSSSGDIAFLNGKMYISTDGPCGGALVGYDPMTNVATVLGGDGLGCVYGLGSAGGVLYIVSCNGTAGTFDPVLGLAHVLSTPKIQAYGADVLP